MTPGMLTSEFWLSAIVLPLLLFNRFGILGFPLDEEAFNNILLTLSAYIGGRSLLKFSGKEILNPANWLRIFFNIYRKGKIMDAATEQELISVGTTIANVGASVIKSQEKDPTKLASIAKTSSTAGEIFTILGAVLTALGIALAASASATTAKAGS